MRQYTILALSVGLLAGCASTTPSRYYTLDMTASGAAASAVNLYVDRIRAAEALTRKTILIKKSPTEIEYYALDEWAASVNELVTEKLVAEFGPKQDGRKSIGLSGTILAFEQIDLPDGVEAHVKLALTFRAEGTARYEEPLLEKNYEARMPAAESSAPAVVRALSACLEQIAADVAADAGAL